MAWNDAKMGDAEYMAAFHNVLLPVAYEVRGEGAYRGGEVVGGASMGGGGHV